MSKKLQIIAGIVVVIIIGYFIYSDEQKRKKIRELEEALNSSNLISDTIKKRLLLLVEAHPHIDSDLKGELRNIAMLIGIQQETKAILSLAKIIESLLKKIFKDDTDFKEFVKSRSNGKSKRAVFADYLDFANERKLIDTEDYHLIHVLKIIRNEEAHELHVLKNQDKLIGYFISGIGVVLSLYVTVNNVLHQKELIQLNESTPA